MRVPPGWLSPCQAAQSSFSSFWFCGRGQDTPGWLTLVCVSPLSSPPNTQHPTPNTHTHTAFGLLFAACKHPEAHQRECTEKAKVVGTNFLPVLPEDVEIDRIPASWGGAKCDHRFDRLFNASEDGFVELSVGRRDSHDVNLVIKPTHTLSLSLSPSPSLSDTHTPTLRTHIYTMRGPDHFPHVLLNPLLCRRLGSVTNCGQHGGALQLTSNIASRLAPCLPSPSLPCGYPCCATLLDDERGVG